MKTYLIDGVLEVVDFEYGDIINLFFYKGKIFCRGIGKLYAQEGFPISSSLDLCVKRNWYPCPKQILYELAKTGHQNPKKALEEGLRDMIYKIPLWWKELGIYDFRS